MNTELSINALGGIVMNASVLESMLGMINDLGLEMTGITVEAE